MSLPRTTRRTDVDWRALRYAVVAGPAVVLDGTALSLVLAQAGIPAENAAMVGYLLAFALMLAAVMAYPARPPARPGDEVIRGR